MWEQMGKGWGLAPAACGKVPAYSGFRGPLPGPQGTSSTQHCAAHSLVLMALKAGLTLCQPVALNTVVF